MDGAVQDSSHSGTGRGHIVAPIDSSTSYLWRRYALPTIHSNSCYERARSRRKGATRCSLVNKGEG